MAEMGPEALIDRWILQDVVVTAGIASRGPQFASSNWAVVACALFPDTGSPLPHSLSLSLLLPHRSAPDSCWRDRGSKQRPE